MLPQSEPVSDAIRWKLKQARVGRLATLNTETGPRVVPVCFAYDDEVIYTAVDQKPKRVAPAKLARVRNITSNAQVALVIDEYLEDWTQLWWIMVCGTAELISADSAEQARAIHLLKEKYPQYAAGMLSDNALVIRISPQRITCWGKT